MLKWLGVLLIALLGLLQYSLWFGEGGLRELTLIRARADSLAAENDTQRARNERLAAEVVDLKNGLDAIEERARSDIGMVRQDEQFFWVPGVEGSAGESGRAPSTGSGS
ncbi:MULTISPECIES: cell division protein FtsB [Halomonadaceae]|uniref:Cell division protein FtsB n=1 Tax=Modicisalibacter zincidurans TaxID=1178777 RepID=A0ABP9R9N9_9GAMM|nr:MULTISPECIES: cell division protein FtsB [Halomonas]MCD6008488.1 cell division protein FtsB [Halomonas sp. IOP_31]MEA3251930.1 cell division protein FtsB [Pseudomonadota bacterium]